MPRFVLVVAVFLAVAANLLAWYLPNRAVALQPAWTGGAVQSLSFAPFRRGQSPLDQTYPSAAEVEGDLRALRGMTKSVRTYTAREGLQVVPPVAGKYGLSVTHGAWLGAKPDINRAEIAALIEQANSHPDTITRVIVGNEVLLRRDLKPTELAGYIRAVRQAIAQPVSYADVWEFWLKNRELAAEVDFITVHFLPYWEDDPVGVDDAMDHILAVHRQVSAAFPGKPILIGEIGWPSYGRSREEAVPGRVNSARFLAAFVNLAAEHGFDYNLVEAFDQKWKTRLEGTVGGRWGLLDVDRVAKFSLMGPVVENPQWPQAFAAASILGLLGWVWALWRRPGMARLSQVGLAALTQFFGSLLIAAALAGQARSYYPTEIVGAALQLALQVALAVLILDDCVDRLSGTANRAAGPFRTIGASLIDLRANWALYLPLGRAAVSAEKRARFALSWHHWLGEWLMLAAAVLALYQTIMLVGQGRYRDFPIDDFLVPAFGFLAAKLLFAALAKPGSHMLDVLAFGAAFEPTGLAAPRRAALAAELALGLGLIAAAVALILSEMPSNREAIYWAATVIVIALPYIFSYRHAAGTGIGR